MAAALTLTTGTPLPTIFSPPALASRRLNLPILTLPPKKISTRLSKVFRYLLRVRPSNSQGEDTGPSTDDAADRASTSPDNASYLIKLGASSVVGAAAIKYGSILFPEITRPNISQALLMVCAPMAVAIFLLIKQSRTD